MSRNRCYSDLARLHTFEERFRYLSLQGEVGLSIFGHDRYLNQQFYTSWEWRSVRDAVIVRDSGCDLGIPGLEIHQHLLVHHIVPITPGDLISGSPWILDPEYLITTCHKTHNAIHYGDDSILQTPFVERKPGDTKLW